MFLVTDEKEIWDDYLKNFDCSSKDIYFTYDYLNLYQKNNDGILKVVLYKGDNNTFVIYPFLMKVINRFNVKECEECYYDIVSAYGYGGPIVQNYNKQDFDDFENKFINWCSKNKIIAEFIRFHPILNNHIYFSKNISIEFNRNTVYVDLTKNIEEIWEKSIKSKNRNMIRKALKNNLDIRLSHNSQNFIRLYNMTMDRLKADKSYYFCKDYFDALFELDKENYFILDVLLEDKVIASAIFLIYSDFIHYHLAGSDDNYLKYSPNNLLIYKVIEIANKSGKKILHLGGGRTVKEKDSLLSFKKSFSSDTSNFYIGKRIHDKKMYGYLIKTWEIENKRERKLFLQYQE